MRSFNVMKTTLLLMLIVVFPLTAQQNPAPAAWLLKNYKVKKALAGVIEPVIEKITTLSSGNELYSISFNTPSGGDQKIFIEYRSSKYLNILKFKKIPLGHFKFELPNGILIFDVEKLYGEGLVVITSNRNKYTIIFEDLYVTSVKYENGKIIAIGHTSESQDNVERVIKINELKFKNTN